ncbi:FAD-dependent oxidoreductase [Variovorax sp. E3]|uniref:FAD-dependent oxidoreductase n=1 Tax=Variovorax sp. E3 TaxID=1914993 RepID=UPI0018DCCD4B|nr:NAD(P)-binding domain-containing protein [Variovorax sp. E3]
MNELPDFLVPPPVSPDQQIASWIQEFNGAMDSGDLGRVAALFAEDGYWRDLLALTWDIQTFKGREAIEFALAKYQVACGMTALRITGSATSGVLGMEGPKTMESFLSFETKLAMCKGYVRLIESKASPGRWVAVTLLSSMQSLKSNPEPSIHNRSREHGSGGNRARENWLDRRKATVAFEDRDPDVLIVGAGQSGLAVAARLGQLGVDTLVVDTMQRVGDNWRKRYHSLTLHNEICTNHLPYLSYPDNWPVYIPKDKLANWFEFYADTMELNIWTNTAFLGGRYIDQENVWEVRVRKADGSERLMRPKHVVLAIGVSGIANIPKFEGQESFVGQIIHSSRHTDDLDVKEKRVLVVGSGTSAHDIAQDLYLRGAIVTMLQRSSTTVVSLHPSATRAVAMYSELEGALPTEDIDLMSASIPFDLVRQLHRPLSHWMAQQDAPLLNRLRKVGFLLDNGEDDTGFFMKLIRYLSGYYINVGASDLIAERQIALKAGVDIERIGPQEVQFSDGTIAEADLIVLGTGYKPLQEAVSSMFGAEVGKRVGPIWGVGDDLELRNMWKRTAQPGLYIAGGTITMCRLYSRYTALLIRAQLDGAISKQREDVRGSAAH